MLSVWQRRAAGRAKSTRPALTSASTGAEGCAEVLFKHADDGRRMAIDLSFGQRGFAALEEHADHQREFSGWHVFATEQVAGLDGNNFRNAERFNGLLHLGKGDAVGQEQREIALDRRKTRQRLITAVVFHAVIHAIELAKADFRQIHILAKFEFFGRALRELSCEAKLRARLLA